MHAKILIVEDEPDFRDGLVEILKLEGFDVDGVSTIAEWESWRKLNQCDILIVDRNLPDGDGLEILKKEKPLYGSLVLSCEGQPHDRIDGINADADYYLVKPFPTDELIAILHRLQRKMESQALHSNGWLLNTIRWELSTPNKLDIELTRSEFTLLKCFSNKPGIVITRDEIIRALGFDPNGYDNRRLEVMLRRLRKKIEDAGVVKFPLQTVYGAGLAFTENLNIF